MKMSKELFLQNADLFSDRLLTFATSADILSLKTKHSGSTVQNRRPNVRPILYKRVSAAAALDISPATFDLWVQQGLLPRGQKIGGLRMWRTSEIEAAADDLMDSVEDVNEYQNPEASFEDFKG